MSLSNPNLPVTEERLQQFYQQIKPYLGLREMPSADMDEVVTPIPGTHAKRIKYSLDEQIIGEWIDGKTLYEKTIVFTGVVDPTTDLYSIGQATASASDLGISGTISVKSLDGVNAFGAPLNRSWGVTFQSEETRYCKQAYFFHTTFNNNTQELIVQTNRIGNAGVNLYITIQYTKTTD